MLSRLSCMLVGMLVQLMVFILLLSVFAILFTLMSVSRTQMKIVLYKSADGEVHAESPLLQENLWLTQAKQVKLLEVQKGRRTVPKHLKSVFESGELA